MLEIRNLVCCYGQVAALKGVSLRVERGQLVALIGANGAGKTTMLRAISGLLPVAGGQILFESADITGAPARTILSRGLAHCPDGRDPLWRRAADAGAWTRPDVAAEADHVRRALARACAKRRRAHVPDHHGDPRGRIDGADRRAERLRGSGHVRPRLFDRDGIAGARGQRPGAY